MTVPPRSDDDPAVDGSESTPIRVLHVDDEPVFGSILADFLERKSESIQVRTERSARAGLNRLANEEIHCVVSDHDMAGMNGIEFLRAVRDKHGNLPFILFTGQGSEEIASEAISAGVTDYLQKETGPDRYTVLANRIENAVEQYRTRSAQENERTLRRNQRRFEAVFDNPLSFIGLLEPDGTVIDANQTALGIIDSGVQDVVGEPFWETPCWSNSPEQQENLREWVSRAADGEYVRFEADHRTADGERFDIEGVLHPVEDDDGELAEIMVAARDVTDTKERRRQLERQNERLDEFASVVSHDLRNPLGVLQGSLALAEESGDPADFDRCRRAADRMEALIDDLLTLAREDESVASLERVELSEVVESCWRTVKTYDAGLRVETDAIVRADVGRLRQLLENLFRNAIEHGGEDVTVAIGTLEGADGFYVEDDGPGISENERSSVFESGYSTAPQGTGFGLSIAEQIAGAHEWRLEAVAGGDGGARFEISDVELV